MGEAEAEARSGRARAARLRSTRQRRAVLETLGRCREFISAQELHTRLAGTGSTVGLTTVYRTLRELDRAGLVDVVRDEGGERTAAPAARSARPADVPPVRRLLRRLGTDVLPGR